MHEPHSNIYASDIPDTSFKTHASRSLYVKIIYIHIKQSNFYHIDELHEL